MTSLQSHLLANKPECVRVDVVFGHFARFRWDG